MADPKYANLPGIDTNQPDVFETSDLPEDDQAQVSAPAELSSESVEKVTISTSEAHSHFKGKSLDSSVIDFSDRIGKYRKTGYDIPRSEYEILGEGTTTKETPLQKFTRLQHEIHELGEELGKIKDNLRTEGSKESVSPVELLKQVEYFQQQMTDLHVDKLLASPSSAGLADPQGLLHKRLLTEVETFKQPAETAQKKKSVSGHGDQGDHVTYQLYYRPEQAKFSNNARLADIEQRIERIEALLGNHPEKLSVLTADASNKSLVGAVAVLNARTKMLDPAQLDQVEGRLAALLQRMTQLSEKKEGAEQAEKSSKVAELYNLVKKWDSVVDSVPHIAQRLNMLKDLHEQTLQFSQALVQLDTAQQQISTHLTAHADTQKQLTTVTSENMATIKSNCEALGKRIKALQK